MQLRCTSLYHMIKLSMLGIYWSAVQINNGFYVEVYKRR